VGIYLMGYNIYPKDHLQLIDLILKCHMKPFLTLLFFDEENIQQMNVAISETEDIAFTHLVQKFAFDALVHPLLPKYLSKILFFSLTESLESITFMLHKLQGFRPKTNLYSKLAINEAYMKTPKEVRLESESLKNIQENYFQEPSSIQEVESEEDFIILESKESQFN
jgi:hypothetical protein